MIAILGIIFAIIEYRYGKNKEEIDNFEEDEIGESIFPGISLEKEEKAELKEVQIPQYEEEQPKRKSKGKHF